MELTRKNKGFEWFFWLAIGLSILALDACGARKRTKTIHEKVETEKRDVNIVRQKAENINTRVISEVDKVIYKPVDSNKPMVINKDTIVNATVTFESKKSDSTSVVNQKLTTQIDDNSQFENQESLKNSQTERKGFDWGGLKSALIWIAVVLALVIIAIIKGKGRRIP